MRASAAPPPLSPLPCAAPAELISFGAFATLFRGCWSFPRSRDICQVLLAVVQTLPEIVGFSPRVLEAARAWALRAKTLATWVLCARIRAKLCLKGCAWIGLKPRLIVTALRGELGYGLPGPEHPPCVDPLLPQIWSDVGRLSLGNSAEFGAELGRWWLGLGEFDRTRPIHSNFVDLGQAWHGFGQIWRIPTRGVARRDLRPN